MRKILGKQAKGALSVLWYGPMEASASGIPFSATIPPRDQEGTTFRLLTKMMQASLALILAAIPFPFGSVQEQWIFTIEIAVCLLMALWVGVQIAGGAVSFVGGRIMLKLAALVVFLILSLVPMPPGWVKPVSPEAARLYQGAAEAASRVMAAATRITLTPFDTEGELLKFVAYLCFFFLALNVLRRFKGYLIVYQAIITAGFAVAILGIVQNLWSNGLIYWKYESGSGTPFGPFVNHNNFAGYTELCLGLSLGMLVAELRRNREVRSLSGPAGMGHRQGARVWVLLATSGAMLAALVASQSRGGVVSFVAASCAFGVAALITHRRHIERAEPVARKSHRWVIWGSLAFAFLLIVSLALSPRIRGRWSSVFDASARYRLAVLKDGMKTVADFPIAGSGLGSFRSVYSRHKDSALPDGAIHAENEYLQWTIETGLTGLALMGLVVFSFARQVLAPLRARKDPYYRSLGYGALLSLTSLCIHSLADFSTHIPSNALTLIAIAVLCVIVSNSRRTQLGERFQMEVRTVPLRTWRAVAVIGSTFLLALLLGGMSWRHYQSQRLTAQWLLNKPFFVRGDPDERQFVLLSEALRWNPWNDGPYYLEAATYEAAASRKNLFQFFERRRLLEHAQKAMLASIRLRPAEARYWAALGRIEQGLQRTESAEPAFRQAVMLAENDGMVQRDYGYFLLSEGRVQGAAKRFLLARSASPHLDLRAMLEALSTGTGDERVWRSAVRREPHDLRIYAEFLRRRGETEQAGRIMREADELEKAGARD